MLTFHDYKELFESHWRSLRVGQWPASLYEPVSYALQQGGKRTRPVLLLLVAEAMGGDRRAALPAAMVIEMFHNFTLIHDDIMDQAPLRRGNDTVHARYGTATAILSGDILLIHCYAFLIKSEATRSLQFIEEFTQCARKVCEGQQLDMDFERSDVVSVEQYLRMIELKTATLLGLSTKWGAMVAGAPPPLQEAAYAFGRDLGIAFQLRDDWLDAFGVASATGKRRGGDIERNKKTYLLARAWEIASANQQSMLRRLLTSEAPMDEKIASVLQLYKELHIDQELENAIVTYSDKAMAHLRSLGLPQHFEHVLAELVEQLMQRKN